MTDTDTNVWHQSACILCSINCGIEVRLDGTRFARIRGDKAHPGSQGYTCEKALRLDHYQNDPNRLTTPLRRRPDGGFEPIDWDTAISEVAARLVDVRDTHGGRSIFYYGGGGQGNHLGGSYGAATRKVAGVAYSSNALAQEKTGEFWVDGQLYGRLRCHTAPDFEHAEVAVFVGKNPWQSHGFPRARTVLKAIANDPERYMVVIDPRHTETAALADVHLQVRPGTDAWCLAALLAVLVQEGLVDHRFVAEQTTGADELFPLLLEVPVTDYCGRAGVAESDVRAVARRMAAAGSVSIFEDLGIQQAPHSTLNSYLEKLLYLVVGSFGRRGAMNIHTRFASLGGSGPSGSGPSGGGGGGGGSPRPGGRPGGRTTPVTGSRIIAGLVPCNVIPDEILTDHPDRFRAMVVESSNPAHSLADSPRMREALAALDLLVVIDVALTETGRLADYVLPAASQFEKAEATFFTLEFPHNVFHLRQPLLDPEPGTLPEAEIHTRLVRAMGALDGYDAELERLRSAAAAGLDTFGDVFFTTVLERPELFPLAPVLLYETLGPTLPDGMASAASAWGLAQICAQTYPESVRRAGHEGDGVALGNSLFTRILASPSGVVFTVDPDDESWRRLDTLDERIHLAVPELLPELAALRDEVPPGAGGDGDAFPFVLAAGERRSTTANTIYRDPAWRRKDADGALRLNPSDASRLGLVEGGKARVVTKRGSVETVVELTDTLQPGHASLPNGLGLGDGTSITGVPPNELTSSEDRDWLAGTPWHKHVRARIEALA